MATVPKRAKLIQREKINASTDHYTFEVMGGEPLGFIGGQYIILNSGLKDSAGPQSPEASDVKRAYSIFSTDLKQSTFEICIQKIPQGKASVHLANAPIGSEFQFSGPWGKFIKNSDWPSPGPTLLLATDTGITAVLGLLGSQKFSPHLESCTALWFPSTRDPFLSPEMVRLRVPSRFQGLSIHSAGQDVPDRVEQVLSVLRPLLQQGSSPFRNAFLAGDGKVIRAVKQELEKSGTRSDAIGMETFFNKGEDPPPSGPGSVTSPQGSTEPKKLREGFTTGACSAAAAKAATRVLLTRSLIQEIETTLPNRTRVTFPLKQCTLEEDTAICSIIKDAGDDPDCTHGAELTARVRLISEKKVILHGGAGIATVTKAGLGLEVGQAAINPIPRKNITEMVLEELNSYGQLGAEVTLSVPGGEEMAKKTLNERLGLLGGISILGTSGIVKPYSTAAYRASVVQAINLAKEQGAESVVFTTGGKSEKYAMDLFPQIDMSAFIQVGDFIGTALQAAVRKNLAQAIIVGMMGKLSKMADGIMMTHRAGSEVNMALLAELAQSIGAPKTLCDAILKANTARHVFELCSQAGFPQITSAICERVVAKCNQESKFKINVSCYLVDFDGVLQGKFIQPIAPSQGGAA